MATVEAGPRPLTARQREVMEFIWAYAKERGYPPAYRRIGSELGIRSPNGVQCHIRALRKKGYIEESGPRRSWLHLLRSPSGEPFRGFVEVREPS
jgi:repressor LexA